MDSGREKRINDRIVIDSGHIYDLSEGGVYIKTTDPRRLNALVGLELRLSDREPPILVKGRVIRIIYEKGAPKKFPPGMAVKFEPLPKESTDKLRVYIQSKKTGRS